jgi:hypothetical protein
MLFRPKIIFLLIWLIPFAAVVRAEDWTTFYEKSNFRQTPRFAETHAYFQKLADYSPRARLEIFGETPEGRALELLIISNEKHFKPGPAKTSGKPIVLIENCIHPGESEGKDASMLLARDLLVKNKYPEILDKLTLLIIPIINPDGHERFGAFNRINQNGPDEMGWRVTATRLNLNRDFMKADAPEMCAWLKMFGQWDPHLFIDCHTSDGADFQYDILYYLDQHDEFGGAISRWARQEFLPNFLPRVEARGHILGQYCGLLDEKRPEMGLRCGVWPPRLSNVYVTLRNRGGLLLETHSLKDYQTRVTATYDFLLSALQEIAQNPTRLIRAVAAEDARVELLGKKYDPAIQIPLTFQSTTQVDSILYRGYAVVPQPGRISGAEYLTYQPIPRDIPTVAFNAVEPVVSVPVPLGYLIPRQWQDVLEILELHEIQLFRLEQEIADTFQVYHVEDPVWATAPYEGRLRVSFKTRQQAEKHTLPAGTVYAPVSQPNAKILIHLLEPQAPDALIGWGFFNTIFEIKEYFENYSMEPLAQKMAADNPALNAEFAAKLAQDSVFAASPAQRLMFFYQRSPYWDSARNRYPVFRVIKPLAPNLLSD